MSNVLTAAVIGCGRMGAYTRPELEYSMPKGWLPHNHAAAIKATDDIDLIALSDVSEEALIAAASCHDVRSTYTDYREMFKEKSLDIITVATRTDVRPEIIKVAIAAGVKGIHAEKPLSQSVKQGKDILDLLRSGGVGFTYGVYRRYIPVYRQAKEICESGELGELWQVSVSFGKTQLLWSLPHVADLLLFFSGAKKVDWVTGVVNFSDGSIITDDCVDDDPVVETATVMFENGVIGIINAAGGLSVKLSLTGGEITIGADGSWLEISRHNKHIRTPYYYDKQTIISQPVKSAMQIAIEELRDQIRVGRSPSITLGEVIEAQRLLFAIVLSELNGGHRFTADDVPDDFIITGRTGDLFA
jgi:scyllo-inositol 2-dehydrogenase (NAD+)